jgi:predicted regulator of Ras-like GTPase activity (Roadblock/LC7/MglB family)
MNDTKVGFLLDDYRERVAGVSHAVALSADGMLIAKTEDLPRDQGEKLAAITSGLVSLLDGANRAFGGGGVQSNLTELTNGYLITMSVNAGGSVMVLAAKNCDIGTVSHELSELIDKVGAALTPSTRFAGATTGWDRS